MGTKLLFVRLRNIHDSLWTVSYGFGLYLRDLLSEILESIIQIIIIFFLFFWQISGLKCVLVFQVNWSLVQIWHFHSLSICLSLPFLHMIFESPLSHLCFLVWLRVPKPHTIGQRLQNTKTSRGGTGPSSAEAGIGLYFDGL